MLNLVLCIAPALRHAQIQKLEQVQDLMLIPISLSERMKLFIKTLKGRRINVSEMERLADMIITDCLWYFPDSLKELQKFIRQLERLHDREWLSELAKSIIEKFDVNLRYLELRMISHLYNYYGTSNSIRVSRTNAVPA